jgi:hypothetical protein
MTSASIKVTNGAVVSLMGPSLPPCLGVITRPNRVGLMAALTSPCRTECEKPSAKGLAELVAIEAGDYFAPGDR